MKKNIGYYISDNRKKLGLTQEELAEKLRVTSKTISRWENNKSMPDISILMDLSKTFGVSIDKFLDDSSSKDVVFKLFDEYNKREKIVVFMLILIGLLLFVCSIIIRNRLFDMVLFLLAIILYIFIFIKKFKMNNVCLIIYLFIIILGYNLIDNVLAYEISKRPLFSIKIDDNDNMKMKYYGLFYRGVHCYAEDELDGKLRNVPFDMNIDSYECPILKAVNKNDKDYVYFDDGTYVDKWHYELVMQSSWNLINEGFEDPNNVTTAIELEKLFDIVYDWKWCIYVKDGYHTDMYYKPIDSQCSYVNQDIYCLNGDDYFKSKDGKCR